MQNIFEGHILITANCCEQHKVQNDYWAKLFQCSLLLLKGIKKYTKKLPGTFIFSRCSSSFHSLIIFFSCSSIDTQQSKPSLVPNSHVILETTSFLLLLSFVKSVFTLTI